MLLCLTILCLLVTLMVIFFLVIPIPISYCLLPIAFLKPRLSLSLNLLAYLIQAPLLTLLFFLHSHCSHLVVPYLHALANSDHHGLLLSLNITASPCQSRAKSKRKLYKNYGDSYNQADFNLAAEMINNTDWDSLLSSNANTCWKNWHSKVIEIMHSYILKYLINTKKTFPWINKQILQIIAKRNTHYLLLKRY